MFFYIKGSSKDKKVLEKFSLFLANLENSTFSLKRFSKQNKRKFLTILKSPHVNKTAQDQFEYRFYSKQFLVNSFNPLTFLLILKKVKNSSFSGLKLEIKGLLKANEKNNDCLRVINPDNFTLISKFNNFKTTKFKFQNSLVPSYIQVFDCHGEVFLKEIACLNDLHP